jgi:CheY-like chemotaxis protein
MRLLSFLVASIGPVPQGDCPVSSTKCRVLCVDDHRDTSEMLELLLSKEDYAVETAATMEEACRLAGQKQFDLYVLDRRLPDANGVDLCTTLNLITPGVPCIFYTGDAYEIHRREAMAAGAAAYVAKPDIDALINAVQQLLANSECATSK